MYRAVTWLALRKQLDLDDAEALGRLAHDATLDIQPAGRVLIDGHDVTDDLRSPTVGEAVSLVSRVAGVREAMVARQRDMAAAGGIVMAGRDIGTVVLPDAPLKVFLDASIDERVRRRVAELRAGGRDDTAAQVRDELNLRDEIDSSRDVSPLRAAEGAVVIHTDGLTLDEVVATIVERATCS